MPDVTLPPRPALVVIPNVELAEVGMEWRASTGPLTITPDDIASAVAAMDDPAVHSPVLRFAVNEPGHQSPAAFAFGRVTNLRATNDGMTLVGDIVGAPAWLADVLPYAWPFRSIEANQNDTTATGQTHLFRLTAVAMLGVELPAIETLEDVQAIYSAETMQQANVTLTADVAAARGGPMPQSIDIAAALSTEDVRRAYYDGPGADWFWWVREMVLDPLQLIVTDDRDGSLWRVPVTINGTEVEFGEAEQVRVEYVPAVAAAATSATSADRRAIVFASRSESRGGVAMDPIALRQALGLPDDATDEQVMERSAELAARPEPTAEPPTPPAPTPDPPTPVVTPPEGVVIPEGTVLVDAGQWQQVQEGVAAGRRAAETLARQAEDGFIQRVRASGRLGPSTNPHSARLEASLRREWQRNQGEAEAVAAGLAVVVPTVAAGHDGIGDEGDAGDWSEEELRAFPELRGRK